MLLLLAFLIVRPLTTRAATPRFIKPTETAELDCAAFLRVPADGPTNVVSANRNSDIEEYRDNRVTYTGTQRWTDMPHDCESIFNRTHFQREHLYPDEDDFPIAYARVVYIVSANWSY